MPLDARALTVVAATGLEARAARRALPQTVRVLRAGIGATDLPAGPLAGAVISCGLAGGVRRDLPTGTVLVPREIEHPDGSRRICDAALVAALVAGAAALRSDAVTGILATSRTLVHGSERAPYAARGVVAVDMESALIDAERIAAVRVVLDTPERELSAAWLHPLRVLIEPQAWPELPWLMREGPRCARLAAAVIAQALRPGAS